MLFFDFPCFLLCFHMFLRFVLVFASISLLENKKIQALVKFYVFLTQKIGRTFRPSRLSVRLKGLPKGYYARNLILDTLILVIFLFFGHNSGPRKF